VKAIFESLVEVTVEWFKVNQYLTQTQMTIQATAQMATSFSISMMEKWDVIFAQSRASSNPMKKRQYPWVAVSRLNAKVNSHKYYK
jgi:xanthine/uracil permease